MSSMHWSRPLRVARPLGQLSRTNIQCQPGRFNRAVDNRHGQPIGSRSFHFAPAAIAVVQATQDAMIGLHNVTHLPWFLTIPLIAVGVNAVFRLPFDSYTHRINQRRSKFALVLRGWSWRIVRDVQKEGVPQAKQEKEVTKRYKKTMSRVYRTMGLQGWKTYSSLLSLPFWLISIDSVRRICGGPRGIIGSLLTGRAEDAAESSSATGNVNVATSPANISTATASQISAVDTSTASVIAEHASDLPDPSITVEGCLWFPDLSAADPYHVLPLALSVMLVVNILPKTKAGIRQLHGLNSKDGPVLTTQGAQRQLRFHRCMILICALVGPLTADLPAALHLYWLSSSATHWATAKILSYFMPIETKAVERCKGAEANIIRPNPSEKAAAQSGQQEESSKG
ncbi:hypothetical protein F4677DRAFT_424981 [Hypoxylon crocopeplum]|nr:hypothetical protein F4677DRAFT_424981 [Hypoxylon crocopeplum]